MVATLILVLMIIVTFILGLIVWKWLKLGGNENKFDEKTYRSIMDGIIMRNKLEAEMAHTIKNTNRQTRKALEEDAGPAEIAMLLRRS